MLLLFFDRTGDGVVFYVATLKERFMQIEIPDNIANAIQSKAIAAGFPTIEDYVLSLVMREQTAPFSPQEALEQLRKLRDEVPRMTKHEIVEAVVEGRDQCP